MAIVSADKTLVLITIHLLNSARKCLRQASASSQQDVKKVYLELN